MFDGRVRDGIGSDHSFMATKKDIGWLRVVGSRLFSTMTAAAKWKRAVLGWSKSPAPATTRHKQPTTSNTCSLKTTHRKSRFVREFKSSFPRTVESSRRRAVLRVQRFNDSTFEKTSDQAARPISTGRLKALRLLHVQPINPVVCRGSLGTCVRETISWEELGT